jgi:hypothetical protein
VDRCLDRPTKRTHNRGGIGDSMVVETELRARVDYKFAGSRSTGPGPI